MNVADTELIEAICGSARTRDWALYQFYNDTPLRIWVLDYVREHGGSEQDGEDIFQEAISLLDRNVRQGRFEGRSTLRTYFLSIAKWAWVTYRRKLGKFSELKPEQYDGETEGVEAKIFDGERRELLEKAMSALDRRCQELLHYYRLDYSMKEITALLGFSSPEMAKKQAYRCRERLRDIFLQHPHLLHALNIVVKEGKLGKL